MSSAIYSPPSFWLLLVLHVLLGFTKPFFFFCPFGYTVAGLGANWWHLFSFLVFVFVVFFSLSFWKTRLWLGRTGATVLGFFSCLGKGLFGIDGTPRIDTKLSLFLLSCCRQTL
ncbi:hypothetical protein BGZ63DRAFT_179608 [Mariannaea sp. PMI_226]|nr:hypothetical protein BGZ63DRAFT_179608 [Mariannaea sp. PMI_226]